MTSDERRDSLADQAAAWVPPWERAVVAPPPAEEPSAAVRAAVEATPEEPEPEESPVDQPVTDEPPAGGSQEVETPAIPTTAPPVEAVPAVESPEEGAPPDGAPVDAPVDTGPIDEALDDVPPPPGVPDPGVPDPNMPDPGRPRAGVPGPRPAATLALIDDELRGALEAILLVVDEPVAEIVLAQVLEQPTERVAATLQRLAGDYAAAGHGFELRRAAGGWRLYTRPEYAAYVERFVLDGQSVRLTQAALETLAVVAYKQPVTRSRISAIRGVNCDGVIRTLVTRGLVEECGSEPGSGAFLYRTTTLFLEKLGLDTVDELPPLAPFLPDDLEEIADAPR